MLTKYADTVVIGGLSIVTVAVVALPSCREFSVVPHSHSSVLPLSIVPHSVLLLSVDIVANVALRPASIDVHIFGDKNERQHLLVWIRLNSGPTSTSKKDYYGLPVKFRKFLTDRSVKLNFP